MRRVTELTTYARPSIYRLIGRGEFPHPVKLGEHKIAFVEDEVLAWLDSRPRALGGPSEPWTEEEVGTSEENARRRG